MSNASPSEGFFGSFQSAFGGALNNLVSSSSAVQVTAQPRTAPENTTAPTTTENGTKSCDSSTWTPEDEKRCNSFLKALQPGGILEKAALYKRPFNAVFIPRQQILESLQIVDLLEATQPTSSLSLGGTCTLGNDGRKVGERGREDVATPPPPFPPPPASARARHIQHSIDANYDAETDRLFDPALLMRIPHDELSCRELLGLLLEHHLALFDSNGLAQSFTLACGVRGSLSETLDKIHISGVKSEIPIYSQIAPTAPTSSSSSLIRHGEHLECIPQSTHADSLNIFFLEDTAVEAYELNKYIRRALGAASARRKAQSDEAQARSAAKQNNSNLLKSGVGITDQKGGVRNEKSEKTEPSGHQSQGSGGLGKFISNLFGTSSKTIAASEATDSAAETRATLSAFQRFQQKMQRPESRQLARSVTAFIEYCNANTQHNANAAADEKGHAPRAAKPISSKEVRSVVDQLMSHMRHIKDWEGMDDIAIEGFEKYIMTKIYARAFCFTEEEKCEARRFENRLAAFSQFVSEQTFEIVPNLSERAQWRQATVELAAMSDYKCPRDKLVCGMNACRLLIRAVELATKVHEHNQKVLQKEEEQKRGLSPQQEGGGAGGKEPLPPNPLPLMGVPPDHPSTPVGAGGYVVVPPQTSAHLQQPSSAGTADVFLPALFLCLAKANPPLFVANVKFIDRYRHRSLLDNESGYLLTCLMSAVEFWQNVTADQLGLAEDPFQRAIERERALNEKEDWAAVAASQPALAPRQLPRPSAVGLPPVAQTTSTPLPKQEQHEDPRGRGAEGERIRLSPPNAGNIIDENKGKNNIVPGAEGSHSTKSNHLLDPFDDFFQQGAPSQDSYKRKDDNDKSNVATYNTPSTFSPLPVISTIVQSEDPSVADIETRPSRPVHDAPTGTDPRAPNKHYVHRASTPPNTSLLLEKAYAKLEANDGSVDTLTIFELRLVAADALRMRRKELEEQELGTKDANCE